MKRLTLGLVVAALAVMSAPSGAAAAGAAPSYLFDQSMRSGTDNTALNTYTRPGYRGCADDPACRSGFGSSSRSVIPDSSTLRPVSNDIVEAPPITAIAAQDEAKKACVGSDASSSACVAAIREFVAALKRENTGPDAAKKIDSAIGNFAYELYGAQTISGMDATKRAILSNAINQLADSVTDSAQKTSIKSVATNVGDGKTVNKNSFYQNSASQSSVAVTVDFSTVQ